MCTVGRWLWGRLLGVCLPAMKKSNGIGRQARPTSCRGREASPFALATLFSAPPYLQRSVLFLESVGVAAEQKLASKSTGNATHPSPKNVTTRAPCLPALTSRWRSARCHPDRWTRSSGAETSPPHTCGKGKRAGLGGEAFAYVTAFFRVTFHLIAHRREVFY